MMVHSLNFLILKSLHARAVHAHAGIKLGASKMGNNDSFQALFTP
jgi:hypothetical protein